VAYGEVQLALIFEHYFVLLRIKGGLQLRATCNRVNRVSYVSDLPMTMLLPLQKVFMFPQCVKRIGVIIINNKIQSGTNFLYMI